MDQAVSQSLTLRSCEFCGTDTYEATLCCWELSFYRPAADVLCGSTNVVGALVDMVRLAQVSSSI